jgi:hypothetical protein
MEPRRKKRRREGPRVGGDAFMDTVRPAFIRWLALEKWREVEDLRATLNYSLEQALEEVGSFLSRGRYQQIWTSRWKADICREVFGNDAGALFAAIERAVARALDEEVAERKARGDDPLEEDSEYKRFVDTALERLLREGDLGASE